MLQNKVAIACLRSFIECLHFDILISLVFVTNIIHSSICNIEDKSLKLNIHHNLSISTIFTKNRFICR